MSHHPHRILHITSGLEMGGAEMMMYELIKHFHGAKQCHQVISLSAPTDNYDFKSLDVNVDDLNIKKKITYLFKINSIISKFCPDIIQGWMYHGNLAATLFAPKRVPTFWGIHHSLNDLSNEKPTTRFVIKHGKSFSNQPKTTGIIYVSNKSRLDHEKIGYNSQKSIIIPNGFNCDKFISDAALRSKTRELLQCNSKDLLIGNFGRWHPVKGHDILFQAFENLVSEFTNIKLLLVGPDLTKENTQLMEQLRMRGIENKVLLLGLRSDMPDLYNALDLFVLSSRSEAFPNVLGEASACGIPILTTDVGDAAVLAGNHGIVVPANHPEYLTQSIRDFLYKSPDERSSIGKAAREHIIQNFSFKKIADTYFDLYTREFLKKESRGDCE